jgi:hypothetical protein
MFGNFDANFGLPAAPVDKVDPHGEASRRRRAAPAFSPSPGTPSSLEALTAAIATLTKLDNSYSAAVTSAFGAIGAMFGTSDKVGRHLHG